MINMYSNNHQAALKYLKDTKANLCNVLIIADDFNIRNKNWDSLYSLYSIYSNFLFDVVDSFDLKLSSSI